MSSVAFFCVALLQLHAFDLWRFYASLFFSITSVMYHFQKKIDPGHERLRRLHRLDQMVIWPAGIIILSRDASWRVLAPVTAAVLWHIVAARPTSDRLHCLFVHVQRR